MPSRVHRTDDGMLFLTGGGNDVLSLYTSQGFERAVDLAAWRRRLLARDALFARLGIPWRMLLAPEKLSVVGMDTARTLAGGDVMPPAARFMQAVTHGCVLDPTMQLRARHDAGDKVYAQTDSHWTSLAAFTALAWLMADLAIDFDDRGFHDCAPIASHYHGDLWDYDHADIPPETFERRTVPAGLVRSHANDLVCFKEAMQRQNDMRLHTGSHVVYRNPQARHPGRVVLFGSSFSDYRAECSLLTFATAVSFAETHFIWSSSLDVGYLERTQPDLVLIEMPERFLPVCPDDDLAIETFARARITAWQHHEKGD